MQIKLIKPNLRKIPNDIVAIAKNYGIDVVWGDEVDMNGQDKLIGWIYSEAYKMNPAEVPYQVTIPERRGCYVYPNESEET